MIHRRNDISQVLYIFGSDFGQVLHMDAIDGMRVFIRASLGFGIKPEEVKSMLKDNPVKLMWLDD